MQPAGANGDRGFPGHRKMPRHYQFEASPTEIQYSNLRGWNGLREGLIGRAQEGKKRFGLATDELHFQPGFLPDTLDKCAAVFGLANSLGGNDQNLFRLILVRQLLVVPQDTNSLAALLLGDFSSSVNTFSNARNIHFVHEDIEGKRSCACNHNVNRVAADIDSGAHGRVEILHTALSFVREIPLTGAFPATFPASQADACLKSSMRQFSRGHNAPGAISIAGYFSHKL